MRVLLSTYGSRGDVEPVVALAVQLRALGAEVRMCAPPDEEFADLLAREGVPMVPFARPWRSWERPPTGAERSQRVADFIAAQYESVAEAAQGCDVLLATAMSQFVARSVAEKRRIPNRYVTFCPDVMDGPDGMGFDELFGAPINAHRGSIGLPPVDDVGKFMFTDQPWVAADPTLGLWHGSASSGVVQTGAWILPDRRPLPADLEAFLDAGEPPVYVGFGSMRTVDEETARVAIEVIRAQGRRSVVGRGWAGLAVIDGRDDCFVVGEVNQQALFGRVAAVVHHCGAGTTTTAARAGAPQVVVPQGGDQIYWAARVADLGIGAAHDGPTPTTESLSAALRTALTPAAHARVTAMAGTVRIDGAARAANLLLSQSFAGCGRSLDFGRPCASLLVPVGCWVPGQSPQAPGPSRRALRGSDHRMRRRPRTELPPSARSCRCAVAGVASYQVNEIIHRNGGNVRAEERSAMDQGNQGKSLRCWIGIHTWVTRVNASARWQECGRCGKYSGKVVTGNRFPPGGMGDDGGAGC